MKICAQFHQFAGDHRANTDLNLPRTQDMPKLLFLSAVEREPQELCKKKATVYSKFYKHKFFIKDHTNITYAVKATPI